MRTSGAIADSRGDRCRAFLAAGVSFAELDHVGQFNARHRLTGTLWKGRYKACLVDSDVHLLRCVRYIDLNPVRARMVHDPTVFPWSSCAALCGEREDPLLTLHPTQRALGATDAERASAYRALLMEALNDEDVAAIRT